jgi:hypothetical protein
MLLISSQIYWEIILKKARIDTVPVGINLLTKFVSVTINKTIIDVQALNIAKKWRTHIFHLKSSEF